MRTTVGLEMMNYEVNTDIPRRSAPLLSLSQKFEKAAHERGLWIGAEESGYVSEILKGYAELVDKLDGVWTKNE